MQHTRSRRRGRLGAAALAVGVALAGLALPAHAAPGPGNIDPTTPVSLTLHKYEQPATGNLGPNTGAEIPNPTGTALVGVGFSFERVTSTDLTTNEGWAAADGLTAAQVLADPAAYPLGNRVDEVTDSAGQIALTSPEVQIGVYLVRETSPGQNPIVQPAVPFLVTLPLASQTGTGDWNYNVHVYPKNALGSVEKVVDDSGAHKIGDPINWTITSNVPVLPAGTSYTSYAVSDVLDARLGYTAASVELVGGATPAPLVEGTHYTLAAPAVGSPGEVRVTLTSAGLALLGGAGAGAKLSTEITTTVLALGNGTISNAATAFINNPAEGLSSDPAQTLWGALQILKFADGDEAKTLEGAVFDIFAVDPSANPGATPVHTGLSSSESGIVLVEGLKVGDYWVVETKAPVGYEKLTAPIKVTVTAGAAADAAVAKVPNTQVPALTLPLTGGPGGVLFGLAGAGLLVAAAVVLVARRRAVTERGA